MSKRLHDCQRELEGLGPALQTEQEQRLFLSTMARHLQQLVQSALEARYSNHSEFEEKHEIRLIMQILNATEVFSDVFMKKAHLPYFERPDSLISENKTEEDVSDHEEYVSEDQNKDNWAKLSKRQGDKFAVNPDLEEFAALDNLISKGFLVRVPGREHHGLD